jgi:hypothetical protein
MLGCHGICQAYKAWKKENEAATAAREEERKQWEAGWRRLNRKAKRTWIERLKRGR